MKREKKQGFTLVELMLVIVILGILSAIAVPKFADIKTQAQTETCRHNMRLIASALQIYYGKTGEYPYAHRRHRWRNLRSLKEYLPGWRKMTCPSTGTHYRFRLAGRKDDKIRIRGWSLRCRRNHGWIKDGRQTWI